MENLRNRVDARLVNRNKSYEKLVSKILIVSLRISSENCVAINQTNGVLKLNKVAYEDMCIFNLKKSLIYDFYYNYTKKKYNRKP